MSQTTPPTPASDASSDLTAADPAVPDPEVADPARETVLVLSEDTLTSADVEHLLALHPEETLRYEVLVPADSERNFVVELVDHLSVGELRQAWRDLRGEVPSPDEARRTATEQITTSVDELRAAGRDAVGVVTDDDPLPALAARVSAGGVREVAVVTYPHALEDTFHRDWASRARDTLQVPVLHVYLGTSELG